MRTLSVTLFFCLEWLISIYHKLALQYSKYCGELRAVNYDSPHPQILHIYYYRPGYVIEPWEWKTYLRWNKRIENGKNLRGSEWFLNKLINKTDGIIIQYRFRGHVWVDAINWIRGERMGCRSHDEQLTLLRNWSFPRWTIHTWKEHQIQKFGPPNFPNEVQLCTNGQLGTDVLIVWKSWFGPDGRCESLRKEDKIHIRHPREWFDVRKKMYFMGQGDELVVRRGMHEEIYHWKQ